MEEKHETDEGAPSWEEAARPEPRYGQFRDVLRTDPGRAFDLLQPHLESADPLTAVRARVLAGLAAWLQGDPDSSRRLVRKVQGGVHLLGDSPEAARFHLLEGRLYRAEGEHRRAALSFGQAVQTARRLGDSSLELAALNLQASAVDALGQPQRALQLLRRGLQTAEDSGHPLRLASIRNNIGDLERILGNHTAALEELTAARRIFGELAGPTRVSAINLINIASLYQDIGRHHEARRFLEDALEEGEALADDSIVAVALNGLANSDLQLGSYRVARERFTAALEKARSIGDPAYEADNLDGLGQALAALGDYSAALETHEEALAAARRRNDHEGELDALVNLGRDQLQLGRPAQAVRQFGQALRIADDLEYPARSADIHALLSEAHEAAGDPWAALRHSRRHHELRSRLLEENNQERLRELQVRFELARSQHDAERYRLKSAVMRDAVAEAEQSVRLRTEQLADAYIDIAERLALAAEYRDDGTGEHTQRVGRNTAVIAFLLGFRLEDIEVLFAAAKLHDVGKIGIPDSILYKSGHLTPEERALMQQHTLMGARLLAGGRSRLLRAAETICLRHHERFDGSGYPGGLKGDDIPIAARMVAVGDVLDALVFSRPYKPAWPVREALLEISNEAGGQFDPAAVAACLEAFSPERGGVSPLATPSGWPEVERLLGELGRRLPAVEGNRRASW